MRTKTRDLLVRLGDSRTFAHCAATAIAVGALTLASPRTLSPGRRALVRLGNGAVAAWMLAADLRSDPRLPVSRSVTAGAALGIAGVTVGLSEATEKLDARVEDGLARRGVRSPRVWLAAVGVALTAAMWATSTRRGRMDEADEVEDAGTPTLDHLPDEVRALTTAILGATDHFGAPELRRQLAAARVYEQHPVDGEFIPTEFEVPDGVALAVPRFAEFPIVGRFTGFEGDEILVRLTVADGKLSTLTLESSDSEDVDETQTLPTVDEVTLMRETPYGLETVA